jgi:hypothetical protein
MPRKALSRSSIVAALALFGTPALGQAPFPAAAQDPNSPASAVPGSAAPGAGIPTGGFTMPGAVNTSIPGTGNPFVRRGFPRSTLMAPQGAAPLIHDAALTPVSFDQPIGPERSAGPLPAATPPASAPGPQPNYMAQPTTSVLPNYADGVPTQAAPGLLAQTPASPLPNTLAAPAAGNPAPEAGLQGVALLRSVAQSPPGTGHPLAPILQWCDGALAQMEGLADYTCTFKKREFVDGKMQEQQAMYVKSRLRPLSVYLHFLAPRDVQGQEAIYVEGRNNGRILAHPVGIKQKLVGTVNLAPTEPQAMEGNRHPITDFGIRRLCERYREGLQKDLQFGECDVKVMDGVVVEGRPCVCIQITHPVPRQEFQFNVTRLFVDAEWNIPCRLEAYAWPSRPGEQPMLVEEYTYANLKLNVNLTDADFDVRNPQYRY